MNTYTVDLQGCADFLQIHYRTAVGLANKGELPGTKIGRGWVFLISDLEQYVRDKIAEQKTASQKSKEMIVQAKMQMRSPVKRAKIVRPNLSLYQ
ncbi:MAG: helix-turn-helix domain-containing protein [Glaciimonas sp.]|nr:helix-turn-helix domain-containing protein [Glaciimonas sp.]